MNTVLTNKNFSLGRKPKRGTTSASAHTGTIAKDHAAGKPKYPYVVVRVMAALYALCPVRFTNKAGPHKPGKTVVVTHRNPWSGGRLTPSARAALLDVVHERTIDTAVRRCVVFGPRSSVYLEPDGTRKNSRCPPGGGVVLRKPRH